MLSPYNCHKIVNQKLKESGIDKSIPPQMMYNYTSGRLSQNKKPLIKSFINNDGKVEVDQNDFDKWLKSYLDKQLLLNKK